MTRSARIGLLLLLLGLVVLVRPYDTLGVLTLLGGPVGGWVIAYAASACALGRGLGKLWQVGRGRVVELWALAGVGLAWIALGVLGVLWPDLALSAVPLVVGVVLVWKGALWLFRAWRPDPVPARWRYGWRPRVRAGLALAGAAVLILAGVWFHLGSPEPDNFYTAPDGALAPGTEPGRLLKSEPFHRGIPAASRAWRILYTTTRDDGVPAVASAIVVAPEAGDDRAHPVIAWAHGSTGVARGCAPSVLEHPFDAGATPAVPAVIAAGWAMVATDYLGLGTAGPHPYLIGQGEGRSVLDSVRAARQLSQLSLTHQTVVWGHSQGGHAALWAGQLAPTYAPEETILGVAAMAPASDLPGLVDGLTRTTGGALFASYVIQAYAATYADVDSTDYLTRVGRLPLGTSARRCLSEPAMIGSALSAVYLGNRLLGADPLAGPLGERLRQNVPTGAIRAPVMIAQGDRDTVVSEAVQHRYVRARCAAGQRVDYVTYPGLGHLDLVGEDSPLVRALMTWSADRFTGAAGPEDCSSLRG